MTTSQSRSGKAVPSNIVPVTASKRLPQAGHAAGPLDSSSHPASAPQCGHVGSSGQRTRSSRRSAMASSSKIRPRLRSSMWLSIAMRSSRGNPTGTAPWRGDSSPAPSRGPSPMPRCGRDESEGGSRTSPSSIMFLVFRPFGWPGGHGFPARIPATARRPSTPRTGVR